ncbi:Prenyltransferase fsdK [Labeo rohita]|uniref:Prenyltransferase fsdK n=1 Tax=Labeo rohita TaxID=84645 RepID=A0ABQ8L9F0_LABRO|nr:Prenyltransferase fsdK [Labeo rohita]
MTITKFGQMDDREFDLSSLADTWGVVNVSYHTACNVYPIDPSVDLLWSRVGLQEVLYVVTLHSHETFVMKHPVSRVVTMCDLHIDKHQRMIQNNAEIYMKYVSDLAWKTCENENGLGLRHVIQPVAAYLSSTMYDFLQSQKGPQVIGEELVKILLGDLYQCKHSLMIQSLKGPDRPIGNLVNCRIVGEFCREVCRLGIPTPSVELQICKYWDENWNRKAKWNRNDFAGTRDVCAKIDELGLFIPGT